MSRRVAFCLVENNRGEILFVQRAYGKEKGKWSLPGGNVDRRESSRHAAYRETREETGIVVKITHRLFTGNVNPIKVFAGEPVGGRLRFQRRECLDVRWRAPQRVRLEELAFGGDRKALRLWADFKNGKAQPEKDYTPRSGRESSEGQGHDERRPRATALVVREGKYLLVKERGNDIYSLPGGGIDQGEAVLTAACREIGEELGLKAYKAERLFDHVTPQGSTLHKVVLVSAGGEARINDRELDSIRWWDGREGLRMFPHVSEIVARHQSTAMD